MRRTRQWLLILTAVVGLMAHAGALRPASQYFSKTALRTSTTSTTPSTTQSTTTTTTTEAPTETPVEEVKPDEGTNNTLSGIPQIDYVWDPNLPRELNGFNLSDYPFLSRVPKNIDFKCDGLHDGFYASIAYKCQIYHHCIYGIRHDFLCANYTAFDQRTFICHFASEVDCKHSEKYFFRNDALYKATTTSTSSTTTTTTVAPPPAVQQNPGGPRRRPFRRRRPVDYYYDEEYDDYYEERVNRRQKNRPRQRRPEYEDDFEDDVYEKRPVNRERSRGGNKDEYKPDRRPTDNRPADRAAERPIDRTVDRPLDRPRLRNRPSDSRHFESEDDRYPAPRQSSKRRRPADDYVDEEKDEIPSDAGGRRFNSNDRRPSYPKADDASKKYVDEDEEEEVQRRPIGGRRRKVTRKPIPDDEDVIDARPLRRDPINDDPADEDEAVVLPSVRTSGPGSVYERPRLPPRIAPPVPVNERKKFEYPAGKKTHSTTASSSQSSQYENEYDDDYEDTRPSRKVPKGNGGNNDRDRDRRKPAKLDSLIAVKEDPKTRYETIGGNIEIDDYDQPAPKNPRYRPSLERGNAKHTTTSRDEPFKEVEKRKPDSPIDNFSNTENQYNYETKHEADPEPYHLAGPQEEDSKQDSIDNSNNREVTRPVVRVIKRPFLPSRGGSPYLPRGLQVVGAAQKPNPTESTPIDMGSTVSGVRLLEHGPPILRANNDPEDYPPPRKGPRTTQPPQIEQERAALEKLYESEYDVTLNDALNPTLKPITRELPHAFSNPHTFGNNRFAPISAPYTYQDSLYSSTDSRRTSEQTPAGSSRTDQSRREQSYYDYY